MRMLLADLEPLKVRPWNILRVLSKMLQAHRAIVRRLVEQDSTLDETTDTIETSVALAMNLSTRIDGIWAEIYKNEEDRRSLEAKLDELLAAVRKEETEQKEGEDE